MSKDTAGAKTLLQGAAILSAAVLISKLLGVISRIPYQNITGNEGLFVYSKVYPLYSSLLTIATAGIPIAISKIVSEKLAEGDLWGARRVFRLSGLLLSATGVFFFCLLYAGAPLLAAWMQDPKLALPIRFVSFALLIVPVMSVIRGYFQGHQNMVPTAVSQVAEQSVRVVTIVTLAYWFMSRGGDVYQAGSGAVFGAVTGALSALVVLLFFWGRNRRLQRDISPSARISETESARSLLKRLIVNALPICLGALVLPLFQLADSFTVTMMLMQSGLDLSLAKDAEGAYQRGQPLVQFAAFFATAMSLALVPSISDARVRGEQAVISRRIELAIRFTLLVGLPSSVGLAIVAEPVNIMLFKDSDGTQAIAVLAFTAVFSTMSITTSGILQGLGRLYLPAIHLLTGMLVKVIGNLLLIPYWGITGAALSTVIAYAVAATLNVTAIRRLVAVRVRWSQMVVKPLGSVLLMGLFVYFTQVGVMEMLAVWYAQGRMYHTAVALIAVTVGVGIYGVLLLLSGTLSKGDLQMLPQGRRLIPVLTKWRLLRS